MRKIMKEERKISFTKLEDAFEKNQKYLRVTAEASGFTITMPDAMSAKRTPIGSELLLVKGDSILSIDEDNIDKIEVRNENIILIFFKGDSFISIAGLRI